VFATLKVLGTVLEQLTKEIPDEVGYVLLCIFLIFIGMQTFNSSLAVFFLCFFLFEYMWDIRSRKWKLGITCLLY
jgi:predicted membrane protein